MRRCETERVHDVLQGPRPVARPHGGESGGHGLQGALTIELDEGGTLPQTVRHTALVRRVLRRALQDPNPVFLFLEDDLEFNRSLVHNLSVWAPLRQVTPGRHFYASLYNPGVTFVRSFTKAGYAEASLPSVFGSQALVIGKATVRYLLTCWGAADFDRDWKAATPGASGRPLSSAE